MEKAEYDQKMKQVHEDFNKAKQVLYREYALSQAKYKKGDIIKDSRWTMQINKIKINLTLDNIPEPVYCGPELKKDLTPKKVKLKSYQKEEEGYVAIYGHHMVELVKSAE